MRRLLLPLIVALLLVTSVNALYISISGNPVKSITATTARIEWNTDVDATSRIDYGPTPALGQFVNVATFTKFHSITLSNLEPNIKYYYQITSIASSGEFQVADNGGSFYSFTTNQGADIAAPGFQNVRATSFSSTTTTFQWTTTEAANTLAWFGYQSPYEPLSDNARVLEHVVTIPTEPGRLYTLIVGGCDANENCANATSIRFLAGEQTGTPPLTADIKPYARENRISFTGVTRPFSTIDVFVNTLKQKTVTAEGNGSFRAANVILNRPVDNTIKLVVTDAAGNTVEQTYPVSIDIKPPTVTISRIPPISSATPLTITGTVNEPVTVTYEVQQAFDTNPPSRPTGLRSSNVKANSLTLTWNENAEADVHEYAVYRNSVRIATTQQATYNDATSAGSAYTYRVSAIDKSCNEGALSDSVIVQTPSGGSTTSGEPTEVASTCRPQKQTLQASGQFSFAANLVNGNNQIRVTVEDVAGNKVTFLNSTRLDSSAPQILEDNLARISPTYIREVTVKGKISEQATVVVFVDGKNAGHEVTDENGDFSIKVPLLPKATGSSNLSSPTGNAILETGAGETSYRIRIEVVDFAGLKTSKEATIKYALCGQGTWFKIDVGELSPTVVTPRLIIEGVQQIGFPVNVSYRGAGKAVIKRITVTPLTLSLGEQDEWDNGWIQINPVFPTRSTAGFVHLVFQPQPVTAGQTTSAKEDELFEHRKGEECKTPGVGCARFFLQLEVEAQEEIPKRYSDVRIDRSTGNVTVENIRQKVCMPIEVQMDVPLHLGEKVPKKFLEKTSQFLGSAIDVIDSLLRPLTTIGTYTLYGCFAMNGWLFVKFVNEAFACDFASVTSQFKAEIAEAGACKKAYEKDNNKLQACNKCSSAIEGRKGHEYNMRQVCDRVACPSAPTFQTYIRDKQREGVRPIAGLTDDAGNSIFAGSSCGFTEKQQVGSVDPQTTEFEHLPDFGSKPVNALPVGFGYEGIKSQYELFYKHKQDKAEQKSAVAPLVSTTVPGSQQTTGAVNCAGLHPAHQECCSTEYYEEWGSACGLPGIIETYDELEQSACLAAQAANNMDDFEKAASKAKKSPVKCNSLFNSVAGFCEPGSGQPVSEFMPTGVFYNGPPTASALSREVFVEIRPVPAQDPKTYEIRRGYVYKTYEEQKLPPNQQVQNKDNSRYLNEKNQFYPDGTDLTPHFVNKDGPVKTPDIQAFIGAFCNNLDAPGSSSIGISKADCNAKGKTIYETIRSKIGVADRTYIVRPDQEGILRAAQCVCLPAVTSYLSFWRNVLGAVKGCVDHTRLTGEGSSGICKAVLSQYVCDMLYDLLRCFMQKYSASGTGDRVGAKGAGDVLGALTRAGGRMQQSVQGRYGQSALWKTMFADNKLLHSICTFAFTGQWDLDVSGLFQQTVNAIPIESQGLIYPADRRYVSYEPSTKPGGMTTWLYHFGVGLMAGADLNYQLTLKCSNSIRCQTRDGYKDGKCDCYGKQEKFLPVIAPDLGNGQLKKNDLLNAEVFFTMQAGNGGSEVRYDTAVLEWEWKDPKGDIIKGKVEKEIHLTGSDAPNFCKLEILDSPFFLCRFNVGDYASAVISKDPVMKSPPNNVLLLNQQGEFGLTVNLFGQADPRAQNGAATSANTKFLVYELRNGRQTIIKTNKDNPIKVDTEGEKEYVIRTDALTQQMFGQTSSQQFNVGEYFSMRSSTMPNPNDPRGYAIDAIVASGNPFVNMPTGVTQLVAVFRGSGRVDIFQASGAPEFSSYQDYNSPATPDRATSGSWGYWPKAQGSVVLQSATLAGNTLLITGPLGNVLPAGASITITFRDGKIPPVNGELFIRYSQATGSANICDRFKTETDRWTVAFTLYDSKKPTYGGAYEPNFDQITLNADGDRQQRTLTVGAVCNTAYQAPATPGAPTGYPAIAGLTYCAPETKLLDKACFCGTAAEAALYQTQKTLEHNCGPQNTINPDKNYCGYTTDGRICATTVIPAKPMVASVKFYEMQNGVESGNVITAQNNAVTLTKGKTYEMRVRTFFGAEHEIPGEPGFSAPDTVPVIKIPAGSREVTVYGKGGTATPLTPDIEGTVTYTFDVQDTATGQLTTVQNVAVTTV